MAPPRLQLLSLIAISAWAIFAVGCGGSDGISWESEPLERTWRNRMWLPSAMVVEYHQGIAPRVAAEIEWCEEHQLEPPKEEELGDTFKPNADPALTADIFTPIEGEDLRWIREVRDELVQRRGLPLDPLPSLRAISPDTYRRLSCWYMLNPDPDSQPDSYWELERIVGFIEPDWTPAVLGHLASLTTIGWYDAKDGASAITLVTALPLGREFVSVVAHELIHAMQDQLKSGGLLDAWQDGTSDQHTAFRWVVEGDATTAELRDDDPFTQDLIASRAWGETPSYLFEAAGISLAEIGARGSEFFAAYLSGADYVGQVQSTGGWEDVNALLLDPPTTTEQIRNLDKLQSREPPLDTAPLLALRKQVLGLGEDDELASDTRGQQALADFIRFSTAYDVGARRTAFGWGVDVLSVLREFDGQPTVIVVWQIAYDDPVRHGLGFEGLREWLFNASAGSAVGAKRLSAAAWDWQRGSVRVVDHANIIWLIATDDPVIADEVVTRVFQLEQPAEWWNAAPN